MRYAEVVNGTVVNVVLWDGESEYAGEALTLCPDGVSVGWTFDGTDWVAPLEPVQDPDLTALAESRAIARDAAAVHLTSLGFTEDGINLLLP